ncbi:TonB-dependent receptor [Sphingopyxis sp. XHP0097]|uniref:TonB-dependent receptor n=1 Tax=Sphingopyxis jiangsuensis TaxID=2871171 RepID=A0ABS7MHA9_9SPHN|nr:MULTISPECIES: TonB-dependent receptor [Sphingopyxis]MBY4638396.1 TonB-dependent receptor [Sphingopyxis jiangsuensis]
MIDWKTRLFLGGAMAALSPVAAYAEEADESGNGGIAEIVVTAEKRASTVQKTAASITAFDADALEARNLNGAADLGGIVPNVQIGSLTREMTVSVRGISSANVPPAQDSSVGIHYDGVYLPRPSGANGAFFDLERVEVLRGPQGTLYGRNTTGGAINLISKKPVYEDEGAAEISFGSYKALSTRGMANVVLADGVAAVRAAFATNRHDGYQKNSIDGPDLADQEEVAGRIHLLIEPSDRLRMLFSANYYHRGGAGGSHVNIGQAGFDPYRTTSDAPYRLDNTSYGFVADLTYSFDDFDIVSLTSYRRDTVDVTFARIAGVPGSGSVRLWNPNRNVSQELRVATTWDKPLNLVLGGYFQHERNGDHVDFYISNARTAGFNQRRPNVAARSLAAFGQADLRLTDTLKVTGGIRYSSDKKHDLDGIFTPIGVPGFATPNLRGKWDEVTWKAGVDWQVTPNNLLYANVGTGFKAGGVGPIANFDPETVTAYEVGSKNRFAGGRVILNLAGFYYKYDDLQVTSVILNNNIATGVTTNAAEAEIYGAEIEGSFQLTPAFRVDSSLSYLHSEFTSYPQAFDPITGTTVDLTGNRLPRAPRWQFNLGAQYEAPVGAGILTARVDFRYSSSVYFSQFNDTVFPVNGVPSAPYALAYEGGYTRTNASLRYEPDDGPWYAEVFVQNIEDKAVIEYANATATSTVAGFSAPRTFGAKLGIRF